MKRLLLLLLVLLPTAAAGRGKVVTDSLMSEALGGFVKYNVYLPEGFDDSGRNYPMVYLLHGLTDDYQGWMRLGRMDLVADELIETGEAAEMVIIMPNAGHADYHHVQNGYFNMPDYSYEDFFFGELMPSLERKYRCGGSRGQRAVMGLSMGGGGSTVYCQRHPELFSSCFAMSAWLDQKVPDKFNPSDKYHLVAKAVHDHSALDFIDNADRETLDKLRTVKWFFDCGDDDYLLQLTLDLYMKMKQAGVKAELRVRNGVHNWEYWHYSLRTALPFASRNFF